MLKGSLCFHSGYTMCGTAYWWHFENDAGGSWEEKICLGHIKTYVMFRESEIDEYWRVS